MKCFNCGLYASGYLSNACSLLEMECFRALDNCAVVNDDGTINAGEFEKAFGGVNNA